MKRVTMELGSNCPMVVMDDADMNLVAAAAATSGFVNAGQVCISTQRILVERSKQEEFLDRLKEKVDAIRPGNPLADSTTMGPMIRTNDAERVCSWISDAVSQGARRITGGARRSLVTPAIVADVKPEMTIAREELFGPAVAVMTFTDIDKRSRWPTIPVTAPGGGSSLGTFTVRCDSSRKSIPAASTSTLIRSRASTDALRRLKDSGMGKEGPATPSRK